MADRAPPPNLRPDTNRMTRAATSTTGVRRNLFQSQLTRRPTPTGTSGTGMGTAAGTTTTATSSASNSAETLRLDIDVLSDTSEIVIRDKNGEFEVGDPPTPPLNDPNEEAALDDAQENERERQKLAEVVRHHQINHTRMPAQPEEVLEALRASMRAQVAALAEDNWMYEAEEQVHMR
ncbi:hypothetical protein F5Y19DRAFT_55967 [Xylariaceae sp. FL1651]|nr:hypothetical protein F5Y19DRAFT_55967 [Xylariaceae sp. FL1651]